MLLPVKRKDYYFQDSNYGLTKSEESTNTTSHETFNLEYISESIIDEILDEYQQDELSEFFKNSEFATFDEARTEFVEDEYTDEELRLYRIKLISDVAN